jgi:hypothetical protein
MGKGEEGEMFHDFCSIPPGRDPAKIMKRPSGKKWVLRRFAQLELSYFSLFPKEPLRNFYVAVFPTQKNAATFSYFVCYSISENQ